MSYRDKIRQALARRAREPDIPEGEDDGDIRPEEPGDGRIVRKKIRDEDDDWQEMFYDK